MILIGCVALLSIVSLVHSRGIGPGVQEHGFVNVRQGAHLFWWLYHTTANVSDSSEKPLIIWLTGGPGSSASGEANFWMVGPVDEKLQPRDDNWVQYYNILFVDSPVGAGFSYVDDLSLLNTNNIEIAQDLVELTRGFYQAVPKFKTVPMYIYGVSYGGKITSDFALLLQEEINSGQIESNFKGIALASSWTSPIDHTLSYAKMLYEFGYLDGKGLVEVQNQADRMKVSFEEGQYQQARVEWESTLGLISNITDGVDVYNLTNKVTKTTTNRIEMLTKLDAPKLDFVELYTFMNGPVREALDIPAHVVWSSQVNELRDELYAEFIMPTYLSVQRLLNDTNIEVHVCNGNLDMLVSTPGTQAWINRLQWKDSQRYRDAPRVTTWLNNTMEGYKKEGGRLHFYWINVAGHIILADNPAANFAFLKSVTGV